MFGGNNVLNPITVTVANFMDAYNVRVERDLGILEGGPKRVSEFPQVAQQINGRTKMIVTQTVRAGR